MTRKSRTVDQIRIGIQKHVTVDDVIQDQLERRDAAIVQAVKDGRYRYQIRDQFGVDNDTIRRVYAAWCQRRVS